MLVFEIGGLWYYYYFTMNFLEEVLYHRKAEPWPVVTNLSRNEKEKDGATLNYPPLTLPYPLVPIPSPRNFR